MDPTSELFDSTEHLTEEAVVDFIHGETPVERRAATEGHLALCERCSSTLAGAIQSLRPATRQERELLGKPTMGPGERAATLTQHAERNEMPPTPTPFARRDLISAAAAVLAGLGLSYLVYYRIFKGRLPGLVPPDPLRLLAAARRGTGQIPLRYIRHFRQATITRSPFDSQADISPIIEAARANLARSSISANKLVLALVLLDAKQLDEAESWLNEVREEDSSSIDALNALAVLNYARAETDPTQAYLYYQRGLALLRDAERINRDDLQVLYNYGMFYEALDMLGPAGRAWNRYLRLDAESVWAEEAAARLKLIEN